MNPDRRPLTAVEIEECAKLKAELSAYNAGKPRHLRITQESAGAALGMGQAALSNHLNGYRPLNKQIAVGMAKLLGIAVETFSPRIAAEISALSDVDLYVASNDRRQGNILHSTLPAHLGRIEDLAALATPRSQQALLKIAVAVQEGRLSEEDLVLLEQIADRFERTSKAEHPEPDGSNTRLRERLRPNDPNAQQ